MEIKNDFLDVRTDEIIVEVQKAFNTAFVAQTVVEVTKQCESEDWALVEVSMDLSDYPAVINTSDFKIDTNVNFRGFQKVNSNSGRTFDCIVKETISKKEFKVSLEAHEAFKDGADDARGLSGSGIFISNKNKLYLVGLLKSVKGVQALNNDILCCSINVLEDIFPQSFGTVESAEHDAVGAAQFEELDIYDKRNIIEKLIEVCPEISQVRINKYCQEIALGQAELELHSERVISAMKFRIFDACQDELINFIESRQDASLSVHEVKNLIDDYTNKAVEIIKIKSESYKYATKDRDLIRKIVLNLINECYLSFDNKGIYDY